MTESSVAAPAGAQTAQPEKAADSYDERLQKAVESDVNGQFAEMQLFQGNFDNLDPKSM